MEGGSRNAKISHHYFGVDYEAVFLTIKGDLPALKQGIRAILDESDQTNAAGPDPEE